MESVVPFGLVASGIGTGIGMEHHARGVKARGDGPGDSLGGERVDGAGGIAHGSQPSPAARAAFMVAQETIRKPLIWRVPKRRSLASRLAPRRLFQRDSAALG